MNKILILFLLALTACNSDEKTYDSQKHQFDKAVIDRLPLYDSLRKVIIDNFGSVSANISEHYFYYTNSMDTSVLYKKLPPDEARKIHGYMNKLGEKFVYRFDVFKDSSIKFYIRDTYLGEYKMYIRERLSFIPDSSEIKPRQKPVKDTLIHGNWQYWMSFDKKGFELF